MMSVLIEAYHNFTSFGLLQNMSIIVLVTHHYIMILKDRQSLGP